MSGSILLFLDISGGEFLIIMLVAFFVFGPKKLPEIARKLGRTMNEIKSVSGELTKEFKEETRNISNELRATRESARINANVVDDIVASADLSVSNSQSLRKKKMAVTKPAGDVSVINDNNNNDPDGNVNSEIKNSQ